MEQRAEEPGAEPDSISCPVCSELLRDPVSGPCGHTYCMSCIRGHWDGEDQEGPHSCPQCGQSFKGRPVLQRNGALGELVEELRRSGLGPERPPYAGPGDVPCDVCAGRRLKAVKSCLVCSASYCQKDLQLHLESPALQTHQLVEPCGGPQGPVCPEHLEAVKIFCRSDGQSVCYLCSLDRHRGHLTVSLAAERAERQRHLEAGRERLQQAVRERAEEVELLQSEEESLRRSAERAAELSASSFLELLQAVQRRCSEVQQLIRAQQEAESRRVEQLRAELQAELGRLRRREGELRRLSLTEDHYDFLQRVPAEPEPGPPERPRLRARPLRYFEDVASAVVELRHRLQEALRDGATNVSAALSEVDILLPQPEPDSRAGFLRFWKGLTLDPDTAHPHLLLAPGGARATYMKEEQAVHSHPQRFTAWHQVLSREALRGRCYWEVEARRGGVRVAVAYGSLRRAGRLNECLLGANERSWALCCDRNSYTFWHNNIKTPLTGPCCQRVGVYLDHRGGVLAFYAVADSMTLLHRLQTCFTGPLHAGLLFYADGDTAEFIRPG